MASQRMINDFLPKERPTHIKKAAIQNFGDFEDYKGRWAVKEFMGVEKPLGLNNRWEKGCKAIYVSFEVLKMGNC